jgi:putative membrane protein
MKRSFTVALVLGLFAGACNNGSHDNVKLAEKENGKQTDSLENKQSVTDSSSAVPSKQDADFVVKAASGGMLEVQLGQLAQTNAASQAVKDFGAMMVRDHGKGGAELTALAATKQIIVPDSISNEQKKERNDLARKKGKEFDKAYVKLMIDDHKEDISEFDKAAKNANDPDIKSWAGKTLPMLQHHLDAVQQLKP